MVLTASTMLPLGTLAPNFTLLDVVSGKNFTLSALPLAKGTVIVFMCNHCPYVKHILPTFVEVAKRYQVQGIHFIGISANDVMAFPEDAPEQMKALAEKLYFPFPYLYDETQQTAKAYHAVCTPDFYLFDEQRRCVYRGRFDGATPGNNVPVSGEDLCMAMDQLLKGQSVNAEQHPSMGCNIKWKAAQ